uniref:Lipase n=1 Tax=Stomoxys calcitrans TaxID=35570 RepID=A0A1I8PSP0_STOCA
MLKINVIGSIFSMYAIALLQATYLDKTYPKSVIQDAVLDTAQLIAKYKYPIETHYVTTEDKYILCLHRISNRGKPPVFLMHGLLDSSAAWVIMGPTKSLGYYLYDNDYDVWMGNARGNRYSRNHTDLNPDKDELFWTFSWHEIGVNDLPAMLDYVLKQTGYKKIGYFGHSQGTTAFWVMCAMHPKYNEIITMMHAIAPVAFMKHLKAPLLPLAQTALEAAQNRISEFMPHTKWFWKSCFLSKLTEVACVEALFQIMGRDLPQTNMTMLPAILGHFPAGCNLKQITHYLQLVENDRFCLFDYGLEENMKLYKQSSPPDYPLEKITAPVGLYYTLNDYLTNDVDVERLAQLLPNVVKKKLFPSKTWNHMALIWGIDAREAACKDMLETMKKYPYTTYTV